jgi:AcrR family transcriptional regulator
MPPHSIRVRHTQYCVRYTQFYDAVNGNRRVRVDEAGTATDKEVTADIGSTGETDDAVELPDVIAQAWGVREAASRGPKRGLTLQRIVDAAIRLAATEGLGALSMGRVASALGVGTMSLYRYVAAKDDLLLLMVDAAMGVPPSDIAGAPDWRSGLARWATGVRAAYRTHPWSLRVPISGPPLGPHNVAWLEAALRTLEGTALREDQKLSVVLLLSGFVRNEVTLTSDIAAASRGRPVMPPYGATLLRLTDARDFPALHGAIASGALGDDDDIDKEFDFGLACILDGVEALIRQD